MTTSVRRSKEERDRDRVERRAQHAEAKQRADEAREARRREDALARERARLEGERAVDAAYVTYQRVRDWAARLPGDDGSNAALAPLWNADRATIAGLRRWSDPRRGAPAPADAIPSPEVVERVRRRITLLRKWQLGHLLVPDTTTLGKVSFMVSDELHSEETVEFAMLMGALSEGAVLPAVQDASSRRLVWEIGGAWGGFAYHFKRLCPGVTYLITGTPLRLLQSAVYLMSVYPNARCRLHGESAASDPWADWEQLDFVFASEAAVGELRPPRLDLTIDLDALRTMDPARQADYARRSYDWGSAYFYSMVPAAAIGTPDVPWPLLERWYWTHPVSVRAARSSVFTRMTTPETDSAHLVGWRRLRASAFAEATADE